MISPIKIVYNSKSNYSFPTFNLLCDLAFESGDSGEVSTGLNREIISNENYNGKIKYATGSKYNEFLSVKITLIKEDYTDLTIAEQRQILSWLTSKNTPSFMDVYYGDDDSAIEYSLLGLPIEILTYKLANNRTVGVTFTFECISPFAYSPLYTETKTITQPTTFVINSRSDDLDGFVYPKITIEPLGKVVNIDSEDFFDDYYINSVVYKYDGEYYWVKNNILYTEQETDTSNITTTGFYIYNATTNEPMVSLGNIGINEKITIDCANKTISSDSSSRIFGNDFSWKWLGLIHGTNSIRVIGNCRVTLEWRDVVKVGNF